MDKYYEWIKETLKSENVDLDQLKDTSDVEVLDQIHNTVRDLRDSLELVRQHIGLTEGKINARTRVHKCAIHGEKLVISDTEDAAAAEPTLEAELPKEIRERHVSSKTKCLYLGLPYYFESDESESPDSDDLDAIKDRCKKLKAHYKHLVSHKKKKHTQHSDSSSESETKEAPPIPTECNEPAVPVFEELESETGTVIKTEPSIKLVKEKKETKSTGVNTESDAEGKKVEKKSTSSNTEPIGEEEEPQTINYKETFERLTNGRKLHQINNCIFLDPEPKLPELLVKENPLKEESFVVEEIFVPFPEEKNFPEKLPKKPKERKRSSSRKRKTTKESGSQTETHKTVKFKEQPKEFFQRYAGESPSPPQPPPLNRTHSGSQTDLLPDMQQVTTTSNMAARIDLHIKVSSNVKVDGSNETETSDKPDGEHLNVDNNQKLTIKVTSEENLNVTNNSQDVTITKTSTENLNVEQPGKSLDVDNVSLHSLSEGDNSVFSDGQVSPTEEGAIGGGEKKKAEPHEEVDDIELIFSSDENKDYGQEDMVSISEFEPWQDPGTAGTPVLIKFKKVTSLERNKENERQFKRQESHQDKSIESDSFSCEVRHDTKSSSLEKESSGEQDVMTRDESFDTFEAVIPATTIQRRWTKASILVETDISKCGITEEITEEALLGLPRRNTCPNPAPYRPIIHTTTRQITTRNPLAVKYRSPRTYASHFQAPKTSLRPKISEPEVDDYHRCSSAVQTDISALPPQWRSESHLVKTEFDVGLYTLPSKYEAPRRFSGQHKCPLRLSEKTQEARRVLLSDINFTSMVPELSRSADHICPEDELVDGANTKTQTEYYKGNLLQTPDYSKGLTQSYSLTSPGMSNWTVNEGSQTTQTGGYWDRGDSFDSSKSYSFNSKQSNLEKHHRSRSVPSVRCVVCRQAQTPTNMRVSESMHYTPRIVHHENETPSKIRGSLPDLRHHCNCTRRYEGLSFLQVHAESIGSAESLIEEPEEYVGGSTHSVHHSTIFEELRPPACQTTRRCSENDLERHFTPPHCSSPFLPKTPTCLKHGNLAKVILKNGRIAVGRIRYIGQIDDSSEPMIGIQLPTYWGDTDGSIGEKRYFHCAPQHGTFVPFSKIIMAWNV